MSLNNFTMGHVGLMLPVVNAPLYPILSALYFIFSNPQCFLRAGRKLPQSGMQRCKYV